MCMQRKLESITVQELADQCNINRGTFYYHFCDKEELICWIFHQDITLPVRKIIDGPTSNWDAISPLYLGEMERAKAFYLQALKIRGQNDLISYMLKETQENLRMCAELTIKDYKEQGLLKEVDTQRINFVINYHSKGSMAVIDVYKRQILMVLLAILLVDKYVINLPDRFIRPVNGTTAWYQIPGLGTFQPSEFMKVVLIIMVANIIHEHNLGKTEMSFASDFKLFWKVGKIAVPPLILIFLEPDTGIPPVSYTHLRPDIIFSHQIDGLNVLRCKYSYSYSCFLLKFQFPCSYA